MAKKEKRMTKQRQIILETVRNNKCHPTADWIYEQAKKTLPDLSLGTVYRNLNKLKEEGKILELSYGSSFSRYDGNPENHYHLACIKCGNMYDVEIPLQDNLKKLVEDDMECKVSSHRIEFYGICKNCLDAKGEST